MATVKFQGGVMHLSGELPELGKKIPDFCLTTTDMQVRNAAHYAGKILVLASVPSLDTPVCDLEIRRFNSEAVALSENVRIVAVSRDLPFAQDRWCGAAGVNSVETLSDYRDGSFGKSWGVFIDELALLARAIFVVRADGILSYVQLVPEVTAEPDYAAALDKIAQLSRA